MFGKSTISQKLAKLLNKSALIEGDDIYHQVVGGYVQAWKDGNLENMYQHYKNIFRRWI